MMGFSDLIGGDTLMAAALGVMADRGLVKCGGKK